MIIVICYLLVVCYGPGLMEKRKSFQLKSLLVVYNLAITGLNAWIALEVSEARHSEDILPLPRRKP